jgi:hypothetical protein
MLARAFSDHFAAVLQKDALSKQEQVAMESLFVGKYNTDHWNREGVVA